MYIYIYIYICIKQYVEFQQHILWQNVFQNMILAASEEPVAAAEVAAAEVAAAAVAAVEAGAAVGDVKLRAVLQHVAQKHASPDTRTKAYEAFLAAMPGVAPSVHEYGQSPY